MAEKITTPRHLKGAARRWYRRMVSDYDGWEPERLEVLRAAAEQLQRAEQYREAIEEHGLVVTDRFDQPKENPAAAGERAAMNLFRLLVRDLGISGDAPA